MDDIRFTKHTVMLDFRDAFKSVPSIYDFRPRANPSLTLALLLDALLDSTCKGKPNLCANATHGQTHTGRALAGRTSMIGYDTTLVRALTGRLRDIILTDKTGLLDFALSTRFCPFDNLGWYIDTPSKREPHFVNVSFHRVIINGKQKSMEYYRDVYLPFALRKLVTDKCGYYNRGLIPQLPPRKLMRPLNEIADELIRVNEANGFG